MRKSLVVVLMLGGVMVFGRALAVTQASGGQAAAGKASQNSQDRNAQDRNAQDDDAKDIDLLRKDIRYQKRNIIATNVPLTDAEAQKFWPVFDEYTAALVEINNEKYKLIRDYTQTYDTMTDAQADDWSTRSLKLDLEVAALRQKYWANFRKVLPAKKTALYEQVERRAQMVIDAQLASHFPLLQPPPVQPAVVAPQ